MPGGLIAVSKELLQTLWQLSFLAMFSLMVLEVIIGLIWIRYRPRVATVLLGIPVLKAGSVIAVVLYVWFVRYRIHGDPSGSMEDSLAYLALYSWWAMLSLLAVIIIMEGLSKISRDRKVWKEARGPADP